MVEMKSWEHSVRAEKSTLEGQAGGEQLQQFIVVWPPHTPLTLSQPRIASSTSPELCEQTSWNIVQEFSWEQNFCCITFMSFQVGERERGKKSSNSLPLPCKLLLSG
jgi:hypothetical protein